MIKEVVIALTFALLAQPATAQVVAKVGSSEITLKDFKAKYDDVKRQTVNPPTPEIFLDDLIRFEMGVQEAEKRNLSTDPQVRERLRQELYKALIDKEISAQVGGMKGILQKQPRDPFQPNLDRGPCRRDTRTASKCIEARPRNSQRSKGQQASI
jgi:hypothetical protein